MRVLFENSEFLVVEKPPLYLSVPSRKGTKDHRPCVVYELRKKYPRQHILPVHRLDYGVGGVMLLAKTAKSHKIANSWFAKNRINKTYVAKTSAGTESQDLVSEFTWESKLVKGKRRAFEASHGKPSQTVAKVISKSDSSIFWELRPLTGRSHQLRYELAKRGFPIEGDQLYGSEGQGPEIALRAISLDFGECAGAKDSGLPAVVQLIPDSQIFQGCDWNS